MKIKNLILLSVCILAAIGSGCGKKKTGPEAAQDWLVLHGRDIKDVEGLVNGYFSVTCEDDADEPYFQVKGRLEDQLDLKIVTEGLEKLNPPLALKYDFESN